MGPAISAGETAADLAALQSLRVAPSPVPPGAAGILVASSAVLPRSLEVLSLSDEVALEPAKRLGDHALWLPVVTDARVRQADLELRLGEATLRLALAVGEPAVPLALPANLPEEAKSTGQLQATRPVFVYSFVPGEGIDLAGVGILNETTGEWRQRDIVEPPEKVSVFEEVDTDGDGAADDADTSLEVPREDFLGIRLEPGPNRLLLSTFSRDGRARLEALLVTFEEPAAPVDAEESPGPAPGGD
jgi:hypothetical protein